MPPKILRFSLEELCGGEPRDVAVLKYKFQNPDDVKARLDIPATANPCAKSAKCALIGAVDGLLVKMAAAAERSGEESEKGEIKDAFIQQHGNWTKSREIVIVAVRVSLPKHLSKILDEHTSGGCIELPSGGGSTMLLEVVWESRKMPKTLCLSGLPDGVRPGGLRALLSHAGYDVDGVFQRAFRHEGREWASTQAGCFDVTFAAGSDLPSKIEITNFDSSKIRISRAAANVTPAPAPAVDASIVLPPTTFARTVRQAPPAQAGRPGPGNARSDRTGQQPRSARPPSAAAAKPAAAKPAAPQPAAGQRNAGKKRSAAALPADAAFEAALGRQRFADGLATGAERAALAAKAAQKQYHNCMHCNSPDHATDACAERATGANWASAVTAVVAGGPPPGDVEMGATPAAAPQAGEQGPPAAETASRTNDGPRA
jgi:hypothetical protein